VTLIAVEFMASTSSFLGGAPGTGNQTIRWGVIAKKVRQKDGKMRGKRKESKCAETIIFVSILMRSYKTVQIMF